MEPPKRHSTLARAKFYAEFGAALRAIDKLPAKPPKPLVDMRSNPETEMCRSYPCYGEVLKLGYYARQAGMGKARDETTDYNEVMFMQRNLAKGMPGA
eukprot:CAMPEP_0115867182 /NCGR_PEP_ID=MMETSP0287-20121206/20635_1 /TAXON_ID=412157 /ORGANISM="Chrysochromulina rotalis, Strain UIO044" /LENGTH=97 /DNA_ID=CAMNT_0003321777 /DNA_START=37 /DNA_END=330 /DNA_ORIENTATION=+